MKKILFVMVMSILIVGCAAKTTEKKQTTAKKDNEKIYTSVNGDKVKFSDYRGKKIYVKYWATWCSSCLAGLNDLVKLSDETKDYVVLSMIAPGVETEMDEKGFKEWWSKENHGSLPVLFDPEHKFADELGFRGVPTNIFINEKGKVVSFRYGTMSNEDINKAINEL